MMKRYIALMDRPHGLDCMLARGEEPTTRDLSLVVAHGACKCVDWFIRNRPQLIRESNAMLHLAGRFLGLLKFDIHHPRDVEHFLFVKALFVTMVKAGASLTVRDSDGDMPIDCVCICLHSAELQSVLELFIDYGSPPTRYARSDGDSDRRFQMYRITTADWGERRHILLQLRRYWAPKLIGVLKRAGMPKQVAAMVARSPELWEPSAWRHWKQAYL